MLLCYVLLHIIISTMCLHEERIRHKEDIRMKINMLLDESNRKIFLLMQWLS